MAYDTSSGYAPPSTSNMQEDASGPRQLIALLCDGNSGDEEITLGRGVVVVEGQMMAG
jgi:hypothetical protein